MNETLVVLGSDWYWEQDALYRFTLIRSPVQPARPHSPAALGRTRWELEGAHALTMTWEEHRALLSARRPFHDFQYLHRELNGEVRYLSASGEPVFGADGEFRGYRGITRDTTDHWAQRTQLEEAHSLLGVAAVVGRFGAWSADVRTGQVHWTEQARALYELPRTHGTTLAVAMSMYLPDDRERLRIAYERCAADGTPYDLELQAQTASGRRIWVRVTGVAVRDPEGRIVRLQGAVQDIDASKAAAVAYRDLAERFRSTLDSLTDGFATVDRDWRITYANAAAYALVQMPQGDALGRDFRELFPAVRDSVFEEHYRAAMDRGEVRRFDAYYAPLDTWFRVSAFPSGQGIAISFTDVTAATNARRLLQRQNEELERRVRERTEALRRINEELAAFSLAVAHDLRAPLAGIRGFTRAAAERLQPDGDAKVAHYLGRVDASAGRMEELLAGLLSLSRVGSAELVWQPVNLSALAREAAEALQAAHPARRVRVCVHDGLHARADLGLLRTLVDNLVGNAWKFSAGRDPAHIEVGQEPQGVYFVRDDGAGFDMTRAQELFAPFRRLHDVQEFSGVGIGLASARRVVERHGGRIWAESAPGEGAVFRFTLGPQAG
ncbi:MAG: PAS domain S-box protein [Comamonadaceae bacterium]|nr:MAG: PAS domain S-box protein [Comamonadaceae bacterium]